MHNKQGRIRFWIPLQKVDETMKEVTKIIKENYKPDQLNHETDG